MKNPIVITSLEEDFKKIGLIRDTKPMQESVEQDENLDESTRIKRRMQRQAGGGLKAVKTQKTTAAERMRGKNFRRSAKGQKAMRRAEKKRHSAKGRRMAAKVAKAAAAKGTRHEGFDPKEALKSFANAAIIAEKLQLAFLEWVKGDLCESAGDESEFLKLAAELAVIAEEFAEVATALNEGTELDTEELSELFAEGLETVLDAVDLYEENEGDDDSITEKAEMDDEESEDEESEDEDEEMEESEGK